MQLTVVNEQNPHHLNGAKEKSYGLMLTADTWNFQIFSVGVKTIITPFLVQKQIDIFTLYLKIQMSTAQFAWKKTRVMYHDVLVWTFPVHPSLISFSPDQTK